MVVIPERIINCNPLQIKDLSFWSYLTLVNPLYSIASQAYGIYMIKLVIDRNGVHSGGNMVYYSVKRCQKMA